MNDAVETTPEVPSTPTIDVVNRAFSEGANAILEPAAAPESAPAAAPVETATPASTTAAPPAAAFAGLPPGVDMQKYIEAVSQQRAVQLVMQAQAAARAQAQARAQEPAKPTRLAPEDLFKDYRLPERQANEQDEAYNKRLLQSLHHHQYQQTVAMHEQLEAKLHAIEAATKNHNAYVEGERTRAAQSAFEAMHSDVEKASGFDRGATDPAAKRRAEIAHEYALGQARLLYSQKPNATGDEYRRVVSQVYAQFKELAPAPAPAAPVAADPAAAKRAPVSTGGGGPTPKNVGATGKVTIDNVTDLRSRMANDINKILAG